MTATFIIEAMALANGIKQWTCNKQASLVNRILVFTIHIACSMQVQSNEAQL
jgi:hypothetical protein